ncbi:MAG TPA: class I SAM-dependent methyltransferase [Novimethylophilus sp.]|jgi:SAM-dependent methyltransferase|uniref:class I SAM-dependent methyltransferase n=1 Tax=Novimethylophilus sp. TaxID=2137426 RepID=UPI002F413B41
MEFDEEVFDGAVLLARGLVYQNGVIPTYNKTGYMRNFLCEFSRKFVSQELSPSDRVLEVGSGIGSVVCHLLKKRIGNIVAVDTEPRHLELMSELLAPYMEAHPGSIVEKHCTALPELAALEKGGFRSILCAQVLHYLEPENFERSLERLRQLLVAGGTLYLTVGSPYNTVYQGFMEEYERRREAGERFPGFMANVKKYHPNGANNNPGFSLFFDPELLAERVGEAGFLIQEASYVDAARYGRRLAGVVAKKA